MDENRNLISIPQNPLSRRELKLDEIQISSPKLEDHNLGLGEVNGVVETVFLSGDTPYAYNDVDKQERVVPESKTISLKNGKNPDP